MLDFFLNNYKNASVQQIILESIAFFFGIISVWYAKKQNIWVYPTGIIATVITSYLLYIAGYLGDMMINAYFTVMSFYGWFTWSKSANDTYILRISKTNQKEQMIGFLLFLLTVLVVYGIYKYFDYNLKIDNYIDILAAGIFFTAMWLMAQKKIENWMLWIVGNLIVVPLYAYRGLGILAVQYIIFTILAVLAHKEWNKDLYNTKTIS